LAEPSWGSCLLVKTGKRASLQDEWERFNEHLANRLHPFMARSEVLLETRPADPDGKERDRVTLIGSFLGGELLQVESFGALVKGTGDGSRCQAVVDKLAEVLGAWHAGSRVKPLGAWVRVYRDASGNPLLATKSPLCLRRRPDGDRFDLPPLPGRLLLFGQYDLATEADRRTCSGGVAWDVSFHRGQHLHGHLLGPGDTRTGLLYRLMALPVRFSLTHGDLHPRNILVSRDDVWLLDFGETEQAPTLYDFTKLEVYLRLWCLELKPARGEFDESATRLEEILLDNMTGSAGGIESVSDLADNLGARPEDLLKFAQCVARIRRKAAAVGTGGPDRRDYLAVLYLTVLETLQYAGRDPELAENFRLLVALTWLLEDALSRIVGLAPHPRARTRLDHRALVTASWLSAPGAPARVRYFLDREDGQRALAPLAATRGVLQNQAHHLDVFDHTLLVMAYLEALIHADDAITAFFDPSQLDREVERSLREQGVPLLPIPGGPAPPASDGASPVGEIWDDARDLIRRWLDDTTRLVLKWSVLFHDVGKPATRCLNTDGKKGPRIQFIGHELYGLQLVSGEDNDPGHLDLYFPDLARRSRVIDLILGHHSHHQWVTRYQQEKPAILPLLAQANHLAAIPLSELAYLADFWEPGANQSASFFLDLLFHGFADALSSRGPDAPVRVADTALIDRAVLRSYAIYLRARASHGAQFDALFDGLKTAGLMPRPDLAGRLRPWYLHETDTRQVKKKPELTQDGFLKKAREMNG
jgi:hypothetical protein